MPEFIHIGISPSQAAQVRELLGGGAGGNANKAMQAAISRTVTTGRALIARQIGAAVRLKIGEIKELITVKRGSYTRPEGSITITRRGKDLIEYLSPAQRQRLLTSRPRGGVKVSVRRRASGKYPVRETLPRGFVARGLGAGGEQIFERTGVKRIMRAGRHKGKVREEIRKKRGPTAIGVLVHAAGENAETVLRDVEIELEGVLEKNLLSQMDRFLARPRAARAARAGR